MNRKFEDSKGPLGEIKRCAINCDGTKVAIVSSPRKDVVQHQNVIFIYDVEVDTFTEFNFGI